jgi:hypothetical protein
VTPEQLAEIKADLAAVPAPPWQWIGTKDTGPLLTTTHSGWQYLLGPAFPVDEHGDQEENADGTPLYSDLQFRDKGTDDEYAIMRRAAEMIVPRAPYDPGTYRDIDNPVARWIKRSAEHATALIAEVERLTAELTEERALRGLNLAQLRSAEAEAPTAQDYLDATELRACAANLRKEATS